MNTNTEHEVPTYDVAGVPYVTTSGACALTGYRRSAIANLARASKIPGVVMLPGPGKLWLIPLAWAETTRNPGPGRPRKQSADSLQKPSPSPSTTPHNGSTER